MEHPHSRVERAHPMSYRDGMIDPVTRDPRVPFGADMPNTNLAPSSFQLLLTPEKAALAAGHTTTLRVLARVQAPDLPIGATPRQPLHLALVIDRSGSMSGAPLEEAKRCARNIVDSLAPGDRAAIFAFDDQIECVAPLSPAADKLALSTALAGICSGGKTNLHGGWRAGADELAATARRERRASRHPAFRRLRQRGRDRSRDDRGSVQGLGTARRVDVDVRARARLPGGADARDGQRRARQRLLRTDRCRPGRAVRRRVRPVDQPVRARARAEGSGAGGHGGEASQRLRARRRRGAGVEAPGPGVRFGGLGAPGIRDSSSPTLRRRRPSFCRSPSRCRRLGRTARRCS